MKPITTKIPMATYWHWSVITPTSSGASSSADSLPRAIADATNHARFLMRAEQQPRESCMVMISQSCLACSGTGRRSDGRRGRSNRTVSCPACAGGSAQPFFGEKSVNGAITFRVWRDGAITSADSVPCACGEGNREVNPGAVCGRCARAVTP